jgi:hypothetical protein
MDTKKAPVIDLSDLGGRQVLGPVAPENTSNPIDLSDLGGIRLGQHVASELPKDAAD